MAIRHEKVRTALLWLKQHNPLYRDIKIDHSMLNGLAAEQLLPVHVEHVERSDATDSLTSQYDSAECLGPAMSNSTALPDFEQVVITDVDGHAPGMNFVQLQFVMLKRKVVDSYKCHMTLSW